MRVFPQYARKIEIYALKDDAGKIRYVGKANVATERLKSHIRDSRRRNTPLYSWVRKCLSRGFMPEIEVLETCSVEGWEDRERYWIEHFRSIGKLLNVADGGDEPFCPVEVRKENGRRVAIARVDTPQKKILFENKRFLCMELKRGHVGESTKEKLRLCVQKHPELFSCFAKYL